MLPAFTVGLQNDYKCCLLFLVTLHGLIDTLLHSCQPEGPCYDYLSRGDKGLNTEKFPEGTIGDLNSCDT